MKVNLGPGPHYVDGWTNVEVEATRDVFRADVYLEDSMVLPFEDDSADVIYCGHILEHIEWERVPTYLAEMARVLKVGGVLVVVGPDVWKAVGLYRVNKLSFEELQQIGEWDELKDWDAPRHFWNCSEGRLVKVLSPLFDCTPIDIGSIYLDQYPLVSRAPWQTAIIAAKK